MSSMLPCCLLLQVPLRALTTVDVAKSQAFIASDRDAILAAAAEAPGLEPLNEAVLSRMRNWMLLAGESKFNSSILKSCIL